MDDKVKEVVDALTRKLVDKGLLVEAGWISFNRLTIPLIANKEQRDDMRVAFFAGAHHLFSSIMSMMGANEEPTEKDMERMNLIHKELQSFIEEFKKQNAKREEELGPA